MQSAVYCIHMHVSICTVFLVVNIYRCSRLKYNFSHRTQFHAFFHIFKEIMSHWGMVLWLYLLCTPALWSVYAEFGGGLGWTFYVFLSHGSKISFITFLRNFLKKKFNKLVVFFLHNKHIFITLLIFFPKVWTLS